MSVTITRVPIEEELQKLVTEDVYSITVDPQHTSNLLKFTGSKLPKLENIEHVKRVKRDAASGKLSVIMCQCRKIEHTGLLDIIKDTEWQNHEITRQAVPVTAPYTREQYEEWKAVWPVAFRPPVKLREEITDDDREYVRQSLSTINELLGTQGSDDRKVAVAIGDPKQCKLVAQATDQTRQLRHPLKHAVMCCVGLVAEAEVAKRSKALDDTGKLKRAHSPDSSLAEQDIESQTVGYLCGGLDVFSTKEPCVMCCMALVHSRVGRLFYLEDSVGGGISRYSMHSNKSLNHHFTAFKCQI